jgi:hypothetical protein
MAGITGHNIAVLHILSDQSDKALPLFRQAVTLKRVAFGPDHPEVAVSSTRKMREAKTQTNPWLIQELIICFVSLENA